MGNTTTTRVQNPTELTTAPHGELSLDSVLTTARIGAQLNADRVELFRFDETTATLTARWVSSPSIIEFDEPVTVPRDWFPWSNGEVLPQEYVVTRDAAMFALTMSREPRDGAGIEAAVLVPLHILGRCSGAVCVYWHDTNAVWDPTSVDWLYTAGLDALDKLG